MYCPKCGTENPDVAQSCSACGAILTPSQPTTAEPIVPKTSRLAIAALVLGILSAFTCIVTGVPALICGIVSLCKIEKSGGRLTGKGFAISGIILPVVVVPVVALLMGILMPALSRARAQARRTVCLSNLRTLSLAWVLYAEDYDGKIVNGTAGLERADALPWTGRDWTSGNLSGELLPESEQIQAIRNGALWPYCKSQGIYRCPAGLSGHLRTYSIVDSMNGITREGTEEKQGTYVKRITQIRGTAQRFVFIDVGQVIPDTYAVYYDQQKWWDQPPIRHDDGTTVSFADGHVEYWRWRGAETISHGKAAAGIHNPDAANHWPPQTSIGIEDLKKMQQGCWGQLGY